MYFYTQVDYGIIVKKNMGVSFKSHSKLQVEGQRTEVIWGHLPIFTNFKNFSNIYLQIFDAIFEAKIVFLNLNMLICFCCQVFSCPLISDNRFLYLGKVEINSFWRSKYCL